MQSCFHIEKLNNMVYHINRIKTRQSLHLQKHKKVIKIQQPLVTPTHISKNKRESLLRISHFPITGTILWTTHNLQEES